MKTALTISVVLSVFLATHALAGGQGAVKIPFDPATGWAVLNTTADGKLVVAAHLDDGLPDEEFSVTIRIRYGDGSTQVYEDVATLSTNGQGKGNAQVQVEIDPPAGSNTLRRVAVRVRRAPDPLYVAIAWDLPLK